MATTVPVSQVTGLRATVVAANHVTLEWKPPATGTPPIIYTALYRRAHDTQWKIGATSSVCKADVTKLKPLTKYQFEILAHN